ncbi:pitrilysin family protein [Asticcacaulis sp. AND118]|uniref:M16 family metallopeptidase n=1 Tax=Asticcacaulis sp. AND118 TaxID=2840468 RepID=UPI001CFFC4B2|nr:pitrilysin family protein [Asticcacaulis sp. AND118]UDF02548.1 insulinase family protein [Asticcacaulis sp. AND118]
MSFTPLGVGNASVATLSNGLRVVHDPIPDLHTFALTAIIHGGARYEAPHQSGWAHLSEHMVFKGAGGRSARELAEVIEHRGGTINASTGYEHTRFEVRGMADLTPLAVEVVGDLMFRPALEGEELEREKKVIEQEISEAFDTPDDHVFDLLQQACFGDHSLARPILGTPDSLAPARSDTLRTYIERLYNPADTVLCVSGGVESDAVLQAVQAHMSVPARGAREPETPARFAPRHIRHVRKVEQTHLTLAFEGVNRFDDDLYALKLFGEILGGGMASRLFQEAREDRGLAYSIDAWTTQFRDTGMLGVYAGCAPKDAANLTELIVTVMRQLIDNPLEAELERARAQYRTSLYLNDENAAQRANTLGGQVLTHDRAFTLSEQVARLEAVTLDDLKRVGSRALQSGAASAILGPALKADPQKRLEALLA